MFSPSFAPDVDSILLERLDRAGTVGVHGLEHLLREGLEGLVLRDGLGLAADATDHRPGAPRSGSRRDPRSWRGRRPRACAIPFSRRGVRAASRSPRSSSARFASIIGAPVASRSSFTWDAEMVVLAVSSSVVSAAGVSTGSGAAAAGSARRARPRQPRASARTALRLRGAGASAASAGAGASAASAGASVSAASAGTVPPRPARDVASADSAGTGASASAAGSPRARPPRRQAPLPLPAISFGVTLLWPAAIPSAIALTIRLQERIASSLPGMM